MQKLKRCLSCNKNEDCCCKEPGASRNPSCSHEPSLSYDPDFKKMNNWYKHLYADLDKTVNSVTIIERLTDREYDSLLSENIVFLNLCDCSAVNTLIECIVRNTPIIINKIPAVVELLGEKYPLYYSTESDVLSLLKDSASIRKSTEYLSKLNKQVYYIDTFIDNFHKYLLKS